MSNPKTIRRERDAKRYRALRLIAAHGDHDPELQRIVASLGPADPDEITESVFDTYVDRLVAALVGTKYEGRL